MKKSFSILLFFVFSLQAYSQNNGPNIILINIDDMGWRDVGFMGSDFYETPVIDSLSKRGKIFSQGYTASSNCAPSRASMMTGKWNPRHGIYTVGSSERGKSKDRKIIPTKNTTTLGKDQIILPQVLRSNGYKTIHAGKWHLSDSPQEFGFDVNIGGGHNGHPTSYYPPYGNVNLEGENEHYLTDAIMLKTLEEMDKTKGPFFLYYSPYAVHTPIMPVKSLLSKYEQKSSKIGQSNAEYATMVENLDRNIGLLINTLKRNHQLENTILIFVSDNGGLKGITDQQPLRSGKGSYYEGGIRVPFFFLWKGKIQAGTNEHTPITNLDIFPTILEAAEIKEEYSLDGESLIPLLTQNKELGERPLFWHFPIYLEAYKYGQNETRDPIFRTRPGSVVRIGNWKLHYYFENQEVELYDLENDISETKDLSTIEVAKKEELMELLSNWWKETNAPIPSTKNPEFVSND
ncbi:arylsulfatase A-like enzyme [Algoriphagus iocasae]|uniref:Arylsulfatase A-like enzyme n=1 Tax=Algoriphagus iocasae TaxID=1836499 RepID=A0A841MVJ6_9BACT|nr:sulfatase [Algoriphagus iocasae]MBB6326618.1 arylsulfatase A-like enzyme [Algoriphagus iocasae]